MSAKADQRSGCSRGAGSKKENSARAEKAGGQFRPSAETNIAEGPVSLIAVKQAAQWCDYLESHARRIYGLVGDESVQAAARLARKIEKGALDDGFTVRDIYRKGWQLLNEREAAPKAINELIAANQIQNTLSMHVEQEPLDEVLRRLQSSPAAMRAFLISKLVLPDGDPHDEPE